MLFLFFTYFNFLPSIYMTQLYIYINVFHVFDYLDGHCFRCHGTQDGGRIQSAGRNILSSRDLLLFFSSTIWPYHILPEVPNHVPIYTPLYDYFNYNFDINPFFTYIIISLIRGKLFCLHLFIINNKILLKRIINMLFNKWNWILLKVYIKIYNAKTK